ncbi:hypothetical protein [Aquimarina mytili]|uniref:Uncharacterized protein n=1 Tax=Aquimarina mytili TaxID=874423 RepID=A0A936ZTW0_9FLAO|nr:hypothetical protein [Aquimarina mytili]MBL0685322.1 hypothetical protein [Aquimarina mytili]
MIPSNLSSVALSKCIVYFKDGNCGTFYSLDKSHRNARPNKILGLKRLEKMLLLRFKGKWETAIIYENQPNGREIAKYRDGVRLF